MKNFSLFLLFILSAIQTSFGQIDWKNYSQSLPEGALGNKSNIGLMALIPMQDDEFWSMSEPSLMRNYLHDDTAFSHSRPANFVGITTFDTTKAQFFIRGVNRKNAKHFELRVLDDFDKVIIPWSPIQHFTDAALQHLFVQPEMAYAGGYSAALGHKIIVDVRSKDNDKIVTSAVVEWVPISPVLVDIYTPGEFNQFMARLNHSWTIKGWQVKTLPEKSVFPSSDNNLVFYLSTDIYEKKLIEYELIKDGEAYTNWKQNDFDNGFIWLKDLTPGEYDIKIRYSVQRNNVSTYHFEIQKAWYQSGRFYAILGVLITAFFGAILFVLLFILQKRKAANELAKKAKLQLELRAIHAQLNPHFVFNALSSIQGLINKNDIAGANSYLGDFARLLRNSLSNGNREQTPLAEEINTLETYLKLEQLRFGFAYKINIGSDVNVYETELPSLLLQPLIENSIKHGISALKEKGEIILDIARKANDMHIVLTDNGKGFDLNSGTSGLGMKLTADRIQLLNQMNKAQQIVFEINTAPGQHTIINLTFKNWFNED